MLPLAKVIKVEREREKINLAKVHVGEANEQTSIYKKRPCANNSYKRGTTDLHYANRSYPPPSNHSCDDDRLTYTYIYSPLLNCNSQRKTNLRLIMYVAKETPSFYELRLLNRSFFFSSLFPYYERYDTLGKNAAASAVVGIDRQMQLWIHFDALL